MISFKSFLGTSLAVQWLRLWAPDAGGMGSILGRETQIYVHVWSVISCVSSSLWPYEPSLAQLLCPQGSPGENAGGGCHALPQGICLTQGSNPRLQCLLQIRYCRAPGKPKDLHSKATHKKRFLNFHLCLKQRATLHLWPFCYKQASDKPPAFFKCRVVALLILWLDTTQPSAAARTLSSAYRALTHGFLC